jgi:uncharacterized membrane protein
MMKNYISRAAAVLAAIIGGMAVFAGGQVFLGQMPDYYVINWLPVYNYSIGLITVLITAVAIWRQHRWALPAAFATLGLHGAVMLVLQAGYRQVVASDSLRAMTLRIAVWIVIVILVWIQSRSKYAEQDRQIQPGEPS